MNTTQALPRFLLPRLSWQAPLLPAVPRTASTVLLRAGDHPRRRERSIGTWQSPKTSLSARSLSASGLRCSGIIDQTPSRSAPVSLSQKQAFLQRSFHASAARQRDHHFDTLKFVQRLQEDGFTEDQAVAMMKVLNDVIEESIQNLTRTMVLREDAAKATYTQKVDFAKLRSELLSADSTESNTTRAAHERLTNDIAKLNSRLRDEIGRTQASVRLDLNLEKGRIREEAVSQELKIKETETKIEQEAAALRQQLEQVKFQTLQWLMGVCTGFAALLLGAWRLLM
ncbi:DUF1640-domain-containing protein [Podospora appendiculata]|uniref:DUF1640-domain-containing protein n=1 Tax=Podospora appendiculata TaxID=314037 RepID=A0AAE0XJC7_9PEZI|nr:DUF1640-domain-containing protein [Podospora appendiculata]